MSLRNQTVVILGGSSGIGLATAKAALTEGANVTITGRSSDRLEKARLDLQADVRTAALDANDETGTRALFSSFDHVDHVFITAGQVSSDPKLASETSAMRPVLDTRFWGALFAAKYAAPRMAAGGSITFISGVATIRPRPGRSVGAASGGAVEAFARALAVDLAPIRVNTLQPGPVETPFFDVLGDKRDTTLAELGSRVLVKRVGRAEELADAVLFLMKNGFVNGITLRVDGGFVLT